MAASLATLISGQVSSGDNIDIDGILCHLNSSIERVLNEIINLPEQEDSHISLYGPYLGRSLMELTATALIARLDPLRILVVKGNQGLSSYDLGKPQKASINWKDDFIADDNAGEIWTDKSLKEPWRAIFGSYNLKLVLKPAWEKLNDIVTEDDIGDWYQFLTQEGVLTRTRNRMKSLYSTLSKGIHHEMVMPLESILDNNTVKTNLNEVVQLVATLSLIVAFVPYSYAKHDADEAIALYKSAKRLELEIK